MLPSVYVLLRNGMWLIGAVNALPAMAQSTPLQGIYTCTDAQGRRLTSDRPIPACNDREQLVLNPSGTVKSRVGPTLTALERAALETKRKLETEERARLDEDKRRDRALLIDAEIGHRHAAKRENGYILAESAGCLQIGNIRRKFRRRRDMIACQCVAANRRDRGWHGLKSLASAQRRDDDFIRVVARGGLIALVLRGRRFVSGLCPRLSASR